MNRISILALCVSAIVLLSAVHAFAGPPATFLRGKYYVTGSRSCVYVNGFNQDFGDNFSLPSTGGTTRTGHYEGWLIFNGDGTGNFTYNFIQYYFQNTTSGQHPIGVFPGSSMVLYESLPNGLIALTLTQNTATGNAGGGIGSTWTNEDEVLTMAVTMSGDVLVVSHTEPVVEATYLNGDPTMALHRICSRTWTGIRQSIR